MVIWPRSRTFILPFGEERFFGYSVTLKDFFPPLRGGAFLWLFGHAQDSFLLPFGEELFHISISNVTGQWSEPRISVSMVASFI